MLTPPSTELFFRGRPGDPRLGEWVKCQTEVMPSTSKTCYLLGCPDDTGVQRNRGRKGAALGPDAIRKALYKMTLPMNGAWDSGFGLIDLGNIVVASDIRETHERTRKIASLVSKSGGTLILLGGGHDFAAPGFLGFAEGLSSEKETGLINIDPHLDVRELENDLPHSGTPFRQILESGKIDPKFFTQFGTRANRNSRSHFEYCQSLGVKVLPWEALKLKNTPLPKAFEKELERLLEKTDHPCVTLDLDSCCDAEGTSAAPVLGFHTWELVQMASIAGSHSKVRYFEIAETAPSLDSNERSARIAAEIVFSFLYSRSQTREKKSKQRKNGR